MAVAAAVYECVRLLSDRRRVSILGHALKLERHVLLLCSDRRAFTAERIRKCKLRALGYDTDGPRRQYRPQLLNPLSGVKRPINGQGLCPIGTQALAINRPFFRCSETPCHA